MSIYNTPNVTDMRDILTITQFTNTEAGGALFLVLSIIIWAIALVGSLANGRPLYRGWIYASFISSVLAIILVLVGLLQITYIYLFVILLAFGLIWASLAKAKP
ncbi:hypothetical protein LCGC14_1111910 [marine sediment metagenome]|uniref:Uncharacterized protein n=1 Tax=marine sediment metagenome TaxID=412755 RepID=A0A0F9M6D9_9ZZZZ